MESLPGISHGDLLKLVISMAVLLATARVFAEIMQRIGQPAVVGEILAGVVWGPSLLSGFFPAIAQWIVPSSATQGQLLDVVGIIGVLLLILLIGMETDLVLIRTRLRTAVWVGLGGLILPFAMGFAFGAVLPDALLVDPGDRVLFSFFLAVALALSAIPVLAKILADLHLMRKEFGQTALAAGMIDDILGWALLGVVTSLAAAGQIAWTTVAMSLGSIALFLAATAFVARPLARWSLALVQDHSRLPYRLASLVVVFALGWGAFTQALHLEPILGAFAAGILFGQARRLPIEVGRQLESVTYGVFAPLFLATAGLRLDMSVLLEPQLLVMTAALLIVAAVGKLGGAFVGARIANTGLRESIAFGVALNARGVLGIIVASIGLSMGVFGIQVYSMIVVVSVVTSLMAPVGLKRLFFGSYLHGPEIEPPAPLGSVRRVLVPVRMRKDVESGINWLEMEVLDGLGTSRAAITLMTVAAPDERKAASTYLGALARMLPDAKEVKRKLAGGDPAMAIVDEAQGGYDLVALGSPEASDHHDYLFDSVVDDVVRLVPCPSLIFRAKNGPRPLRTILVPTTGSAPSTRAAELAYAIAGPETLVILFHVVDLELSTQTSTGRSHSLGLRLEIAHDMLGASRAVGESSGATVSTEVIQGGHAIPAILERAGRGIDLVILGTNVRAGTGHLYLGPTVERILRRAPCSVIVFNT